MKTKKEITEISYKGTVYHVSGKAVTFNKGEYYICDSIDEEGNKINLLIPSDSKEAIPF